MKQTTRINLTIFKNNLFEAGTEFFNQLGIRLNSNTAASLGSKDLLKDQYKNKDIFKAIKETYFLGLVDDTVFEGNAPLLSDDKISLQEATGKINADYNGLMVFAVKLDDSYSPARGRIAELTRAFNRASKNIPVVLLLKYGNLLSFSTCERTKYKQDWREGEKIGKISLLKDINIDSPHTGHLRILYDLKIEPNVTDFNALYKQWQAVFDVQLLNKKFYQELFYWYLWAVKEVKFPQMRPKEDLIPDDAHQSESVIRLLTRLLFCWFMKEKQKLIPELLFDKNEIRKILTGFSPENSKSSVFYRAMLQNLFFATLSVPINKRKYIREAFKGINKDYGNQYVYRYQNEFVDAKENLKLFKDIPFLNGGLFECLDEKPENDNEKEIRLDGFSTIKKKQAFVPDHIFWDEHRGIDLSKELDKPKKKNETVHGIIDILNSYKFTIEENTPMEEEIALDPELLGKVFESLLAYYNPETKANARKQTGSFYTPREIVNYMVDESLIAAFQQKLRDAGITENAEERLRDLISYSKTDNPFTEKETGLLIQTLENLKVLDPACGSGAFPMGILHKLVWVLQKVDPENKRWFESIIKRLPDYAQAEMRKKLEGENWDYLRKLGVIQQSIYGVDIQPIAIQIAKLRFFISLLVDQDIKGNRENNFGLQPLPNLDFKLVSANTLIGAPEQSQPKEGGLFFAQDEFFDKFNALTGQYFGTYEPAEKKKLTKKIEKLVSSKVQEKVDQIQSLSTHTDKRFSKHVAKKNKALIEQKKNDAKLWESYNNLFKHESVAFFETRYFFPEAKEGFDVVIGNPPYGVRQIHTAATKEYFKTHYAAAQGSFENYFLFYEAALNMLNVGGIQAFIAPVTWLTIPSAKSLRKLILLGYAISEITWLSEAAFENASVNTLISFIQKRKSDKTIVNVFDKLASFPMWPDVRRDMLQGTFVDNDYYISIFSSAADTDILKKIKESSMQLGDIATPCSGYNPYEVGAGIAPKGGPHTKQTVKNKPYHANRKLGSEWSPEIVGRDLNRYYVRITGTRWVKYGPWLAAARDKNNFNGDRILVQEITGGLDKRIVAAFYNRALYHSRDIIPIKLSKTQYASLYLLALINSKLISWVHSKCNPKAQKGLFPKILVSDLKQIPVYPASDVEQTQIVKNVQLVIAAKKKDPNADTSALERQIDDMVYALYNLTPEEIAIVEGDK